MLNVRSAIWRTAFLTATAAAAVFGAACGSDEAKPQAAATTPTAAPANAAVPTVVAAKAGYAFPDKLVTTTWVTENATKANVLVLDLRKKEDYDAGHIPGASWINTADLSVTDKNGVKGQIAPAEKVASVFAAVGAKPDTTIVLYDASNNLSSSRVLWVLEVYGHKDVRMMDGTWTLWQSESKPATKDVPQRTATQYAFTATPNEGIIANFDEIVKAVGDPSKVVCDARTPEEYAGRDVRSKNGGHIPGAVNVNYTLANGKDGKYLPAEELRKLYGDAGVKASDSQTVYTYCQTGVRAAHSWFVLKYLVGYKNVENYDGSWEEWGNKDGAKIETSR